MRQNVVPFHLQFLVLGPKQGSFMTCTIALWTRGTSWRRRFVLVHFCIICSPVRVDECHWNGLISVLCSSRLCPAFMRTLMRKWLARKM